jgi:hypothetical protein
MSAKRRNRLTISGCVANWRLGFNVSRKFY